MLPLELWRPIISINTEMWSQRVLVFYCCIINYPKFSSLNVGQKSGMAWLGVLLRLTSSCWLAEFSSGAQRHSCCWQNSVAVVELKSCSLAGNWLETTFNSKRTLSGPCLGSLHPISVMENLSHVEFLSCFAYLWPPILWLASILKGLFA